MGERERQYQPQGPQHRPHNKESIQKKQTKKNKFASGAINTVLRKESAHEKGKSKHSLKVLANDLFRRELPKQGKENPVSRSSERPTPQQKNTAYKQTCLSGLQHRLHTNESTQNQGQQDK